MNSSFETKPGDEDGIDSGHISSIMVLEVVVCVIGVIANLTVILVSLVLREYRKTLTHWYVLQLAVADCAFLLTIPFSYSEAHHGRWIYSNGMCKAKETILFLNYHASILFLVVMSLDRYIAVCHAHSNLHMKLRNRRASIVTTVMVWVLSLVFCIPMSTYSTVIADYDNHCICGYVFPKPRQSFRTLCSKLVPDYDVHECATLLLGEIEMRIQACVNAEGSLISSETSDEYNYTEGDDISGSGMSPMVPEPETCNDDHQGPGWTAYLRFLFIGMFIIPLLVMTYCYISIIRQLQKTVTRQGSIMASGGERYSSSRRRRSRRISASSEKADKKITRVNITCASLVLIFIVCWLPFHSYHVAKSYGIYQSTGFCEKLLKAVSLLIYINSAVNPLIYNFIGTKFRSRIRRAASTMKSSVRRTSHSSQTAAFRSTRRRSGSRSSTGAVTLTTHANKSSHSASNENGNGENLSMIAMKSSIADQMTDEIESNGHQI